MRGDDSGQTYGNHLFVATLLKTIVPTNVRCLLKGRYICGRQPFVSSSTALSGSLHVELIKYRTVVFSCCRDAIVCMG